MSWKIVRALAVTAILSLTALNLDRASIAETQPTLLLPPPTDEVNQVSAIAISPDEKILAVARRNESQIQLRHRTGEINRISGHTKPISSLVFIPQRNILVSASDDKTIKLWDANTGRLIQTLTGHTEAVKVLAISRDGRLLASGSGDKTIKLWDLDTGRLIRTLRGHTEAVVSLAFNPDRSLLASGSVDESLKIWDLQTGLPQSYTDNPSPYGGHLPNVVSAIAFSPDGESVASALADNISKGNVESNTIRIRSLKTGQIVRRLAAGSGKLVQAIAYTPDGQTLIATVEDIKLWNLKTGVQQTLAIAYPLTTLTQDGQTLVTEVNGNFTFWDIPALISELEKNQ